LPTKRFYPRPCPNLGFSAHRVQQSNERAKARPGQPESGDIVIAKAVHVAISRGESTVAINNILKSEPPALVKRSLEVSKHGAAALFTAVRGDRIDILRALIVHGVDPNTRHTSGMPILAAAIFQSNASAVVSVSILLELGQIRLLFHGTSGTILQIRRTYTLQRRIWQRLGGATRPIGISSTSASILASSIACCRPAGRSLARTEYPKLKT
jgi:hypothetical protein